MNMLREKPISAAITSFASFAVTIASRSRAASRATSALPVS